MYKWEIGGYPSWFRARVLVWHKNHVLVESHVQDAVNAKMKQKSGRR